MNNNFIYTNTVVRFYDIMYERLLDKSNKEFYLKEIKNAKGPILEIGTGTGRIFMPALNSGADIYGIDISEVMQKYLKEKISSKEHDRLIFADVRNFQISKKFDLIIAPFRIFSHLLTVDDQVSALNKIKEHLSDDGKFIMDVFLPNLDLISKGSEYSLIFDGEYEPGKCVKRYESAKPEYINQLQHVLFKYVWDENDGLHEDNMEFPFRYFFRFELEHLIARSGLKLNKMYGDFEYGELNPSSKNFVCVCTKN